MTTFDLPEFIASLKSLPEPIVFRPNTGNPGDSLIALAAMQLLERHKIPYTFLSPLARRANLRGKCLLVNGGGLLVSHYSYDYSRLIALSPSAQRVVVLPKTISAYPDLLQLWGHRATIFVREPTSYDYVSRFGLSPVLSHDTVFWLDTANALAGPADFPWRALFSIPPVDWPVEKLPKYLPGLIRGALSVNRKLDSQPADRLYFLRADLERTDIPIPEMNREYGYPGPFMLAHPELIRYTARKYLQFIDSCKEIHTNRLHGAIPAALLGKQVYFYDNSTHKCRDIYYHSMQGRFPNVTWMGDSDPPGQ